MCFKKDLIHFGLLDVCLADRATCQSIFDKLSQLTQDTFCLLEFGSPVSELFSPDQCSKAPRRSPAKLDPQTRINVDFKPSKKMKKRRDLDALVNGKLGGRRKKNGQHELLRNTDSSDMEEFAIPPQNLARK